MHAVRLAASFIAAFVLAGTLVSCGSEKSGRTAGGERDRQITVGVTLLTEEHPFYRELKSSFVARAQERGLNPVVVSCNMDLSTQTSQIEHFITRGVDAMVVCPADSAGIVGAIRKANKAEIPVFTADIAAEGGDVVSHIASDNVQGGRLAGEFMARSLGGKGLVAIVNHPTVRSVQDRVKGFREAVAAYPDIRIVDDQAAQGMRDVAVTVTENLLQKHPNLDGIFAINDSSALGALAAIQQAGRGDIVLVGYDGDPEARRKILAGTPLKADAVQYPRHIGRITADTVADHFEGKQVEKLVRVEVGIIDRDSLLKEQD